MNKLYLSWLTQHLDTNKTNRELVNISEAKGKKPQPKKVKVEAEKQTDDGEDQEPKEPKPSKRSEAATKRNVADRIEAEKNKESGTNPEDLAAALHGIRHASELEQAIGSPDSVFRSQEREPSRGTGAQYRKTESPEDVMARMMREGFFGNMAAGAGKLAVKSAAGAGNLAVKSAGLVGRLGSEAAGNLAGQAAGGIARAGATAVNLADKGIVGAGKLAGQAGKLAGQAGKLAGGEFKAGMGSSLGTAANTIKSGPLAQKLGGAIKVVGGLAKKVSSNPTVRGLASKGVDAIKANISAKMNDNGSKQTGTPVPPDGGAKPAAGVESAPAAAGGNSSSNTNTVGRDQTNSNNTITNNYGGGGAAGGKAAPQQQASELGTASGGDIIRGGAREASGGRVPAISGKPRISMNEETKPQSNLSRIMEMRNRLSAKYGD